MVRSHTSSSGTDSPKNGLNFSLTSSCAITSGVSELLAVSVAASVAPSVEASVAGVVASEDVSALEPHPVNKLARSSYGGKQHSHYR